jgi:hypothetical protein
VKLVIAREFLDKIAIFKGKQAYCALVRFELRVLVKVFFKFEETLLFSLVLDLPIDTAAHGTPGSIFVAKKQDKYACRDCKNHPYTNASLFWRRWIRRYW